MKMMEKIIKHPFDNNNQIRKYLKLN